MIYADHLQRAAARTRALGHEVADGTADALAPDDVRDALAALADLIGGLPARLARADCDVSLECTRLALAALPRFAQATGCRPIITLGSVAYNGVPILCADVENIRALRQRSCYHVWWSLGDAQVIDLTLMAQLALLHKPGLPAMLPIVGAPDQHARIQWRPYLLGETLLRALVNDGA